MTGSSAQRRLLAATLVAAWSFLAITARVAAAPAPGAVYEGTTSAAGTVRITINANGTAAVSVQHPGVGVGCAPASFTVGAVPLAANGSQFTVTDAPASNGTASMSGFVSLPGDEVIAGAFTDQSSLSACAPHSATWSARRVTPAVAPSAWPFATGGRLAGSSYSVTGTRIGSVEAVHDTGGRLTVTIVATTSGCEYRAAPVVPAGSLAGPSIEAGSGATRVVAVASPGAIGGGFVIERTAEGCGPLAGMWVAAASPPGFATTPNFGTRFMALSVFTGGSAAQLEAAARTAGAMGAWVQDATGRFVLLVVDGPAFVNDPFRATFASGIASNTAVTLVR